MNDVAGRLGVAKPTLYKLAGSRDALLRTCWRRRPSGCSAHLHDARRTRCARWRPTPSDSPGGFRLLFGRAGRWRRRRCGAPGDAAWPTCRGAAAAAAAELSDGRSRRSTAARTPAGIEPTSSAFDQVAKPGAHLSTGRGYRGRRRPSFLPRHE